jgi:CRP/FNR family cyclic AMP-dependent transcriptional regulator
LATLDVNGRVARQLLAFAEKYPREKDGVTQISITLTQGDIADLVGASRKRVNQAMVLFKEQDLIDDADGRIAIKDSKGLARYCR